MLILVVLACAHRLPSPFVTTGGDAPTRAQLAQEGVVVAPVMLARDLPAPALPPLAAPGVLEAGLEAANLPAPTILDPVADAPFLRNDYVGNVRFGGGFIRSGDVALQVRARLMEFNEQEKYADQGARWLADALGGVLSARKVPVSALPAAVGPLPLTVTWVPRRGLDPDDGHDDVNLPRTDLRFGPLPPNPSAATPWLLVPVLRAYTSHTGGWFIGQEYGCMAGARVTVAIALYDVRRGEPVWWMEATGRKLDSGTAVPSVAQLDQYLLDAETIVAGAMEDRFLN